MIDVDTYQRDGFAVVRNILDLEELETLRDAATDVCEALKARPDAWGNTVDWERDHVDVPEEDPTHGEISRIEPIIDLSDEFARIALDPRITAPAKAIFGDEVGLFEDKLNLKLPGGRGFPWHQDWSCCLRAHTDELVTCFLSLDDTTPTNGPLQVIPGSHATRECFPFRQDYENQQDPAYRKNFEVDPAAIDPSQVVVTELRAGDMIVFDSLLLHYSERNRSEAPRRTIIFTYHPARLGDLYSYTDLLRERAALTEEVRRPASVA